MIMTKLRDFERSASQPCRHSMPMYIPCVASTATGHGILLKQLPTCFTLAAAFGYAGWLGLGRLVDPESLHMSWIENAKEWDRFRIELVCEKSRLARDDRSTTQSLKPYKLHKAWLGASGCGESLENHGKTHGKSMEKTQKS